MDLLLSTDDRTTIYYKVFNFAVPYFCKLTTTIIVCDVLMQVMWDDLIGEPEGVQSPDCTWNCSRACFQVTLANDFIDNNCIPGNSKLLLHAAHSPICSHICALCWS